MVNLKRVYNLMRVCVEVVDKMGICVQVAYWRHEGDALIFEAQYDTMAICQLHINQKSEKESTRTDSAREWPQRAEEECLREGGRRVERA